MKRSFLKHRLGIAIPLLSLLLGLSVQPGTSTLAATDLSDDPRVQNALGLLEVWVDAELAFQHLPGISMAVVYDQDPLWSRGFGVTDLDTEKPTTPRTIYSICSISKLFTSIGVMQLYDQGKLRLDDRVDTLIPWFNLKEAHQNSGPITVRGLLSHASGLPRESDFPYWTGPDFQFPTREEIKAKISSQETLYPAEAYFQYSNLGLTLAGELIHQLSGQSYSEYMQTRILDPLGLQDTFPEMPFDEQGKRLATGYGTLTREGTRPKMPFFQAQGIAPAAGYASTVEDLAKFASWQFRLLEKEGTEILKASTLREMQRVQWIDPDWKEGTSRGLGFWVRRQDETTFVGHGGSCPGYRSELRLNPSEKIAVVFMTNAMSIDPTVFTRRAHQMVGKAISEAVKNPGKGIPDDPALVKYTGLYRGDWGETAVIHWKGALAFLELPTNDPVGDLETLRQETAGTFRRVRSDGSLGEQIRFDLDASGQVFRMWRHSNYDAKVR
jgi:CubicO group peptidase (beta-lactamase class C family)